MRLEELINEKDSAVFYFDDYGRLFFHSCFQFCRSSYSGVVALVNNVKGDELAGQIFYQEAIGTLNDYPEYMMIENDKLTAAIEKAHITYVTDEAALRAIAKMVT